VLAPGLPTMAATGLPGYAVRSLNTMWAPAKTPDASIKQLNQEIVRFLTRPDVKERFLSNGSEVVGSSPEQLAAAVKADVAKMGKMIKDVGINAD
jgi:tripartite-type tricarboxylate transporter receptor subunit TctC